METKNAIVIGASSGIGAELSKVLTQNHYKVIASGRRTELLSDVRSFAPDLINYHFMDVKDLKSTKQTLENLKSELGTIDLLVICAGTGDINHELNSEIELNTVDTNVLGFTNIATWAFNLFAEQGHGHLVGISSIAGIRGSRHAPAYNASKAYQINYLEGLKQKAKKLKLPVYVTDIRPGFVDTDMAKGEGLFWVTPTAKAAKQIYNDIKNKRNTAYVSRRWELVAAVLSLIPEFLYTFL
ncbi:MAG TPA: SDR family NAD(P)-dependent oxidoreductase [Bacteroidia bacterium]